jgi:hypothetical protein
MAHKFGFAAAASIFLIVSSTPANAVLFTFDDLPPHTSLPSDYTVDGLTAHFSGTGQGFSIQPADALGFTPSGFGGLSIYPNSIYAADLLVSFSQSLSGFSILYAPEEYGSDRSAIMRVTAYLNGKYVGTNTTTAPNPGPWPTGPLTFDSASRDDDPGLLRNRLPGISPQAGDNFAARLTQTIEMEAEAALWAASARLEPR